MASFEEADNETTSAEEFNVTTNHSLFHAAAGHGHGGHGGSGCYSHTDCVNGKLIPLWRPSPLQLPPSLRFGRSMVLIIALSYLFLGVSIISDKFVEALENIVSQKRKVRVVSPTTGRPEFIHVAIWNETVAHLTLAVVGSTAPEIMLASVDVLVHNFDLGDLGPATIVGAGAYNLFIVTAICMASVKKGEVKRIKELHIFFVTAAFGISAYVWLYVLISVISPGVVDLWEALLTFSFFPLTVLASYLADKQCFGVFSIIAAKWKRRLTAVGPASSNNVNHANGVSNNQNSSMVNLATISGEGDYNKVKHQASSVSGADAEASSNHSTLLQMTALSQHGQAGAQKIFASRQQRYVELAAELRRKFPNVSNEEVSEMAQLELVKELPKSLTYYRTQALRRAAGAEDVITRRKLRDAISRTLSTESLKSKIPDVEELTNRNQQIVYFEPNTCTVVEDAGSFTLNIVRHALDLDNEISVGYKTIDGTAKAEVDYRRAEGRVMFKRGEAMKQITLEVIDDEIFNDDTVFYVDLFEPLVEMKSINHSFPHRIFEEPGSDALRLTLGKNRRATVTKLDDDHGGIFHFPTDSLTIEESVGVAEIKVMRSAGGKGCVDIPLQVEGITAKPKEQYEVPGNKLEIHFSNRQSEGVLKLRIADEKKLDKKASLRVILGEPRWSPAQFNGDEKLDTSQLGAPRLKQPSTLMVVIVESSQLKLIVDDIATMDVYNNFVVATSTWRDQLRSAFTVSGGHPEGDDESSPATSSPKWHDYLLHVIAFVWKLLVALTPPTELWHGWPAAFCCLLLMGFVILVIDDLSVQLGCTIGLSDELTAITFVSLGTSLPDMFASRIAAMREESADSAIGHISGAAAANVFFGIGLSWTIATSAHAIQGTQLIIQPGSLGFSVTLYFTFAVCSLAVLMLRRLPPIGGELGGPTVPRIATCVLLILFWLTYIITSALDNYCVISTY